MILVADSGSSKTDWMGYIDGKTIKFDTPGINPYFLSEEEISKLVARNETMMLYADKVKEIYFFGAGCSSPDKHEVVSNGLSAIFKNAFISVDHDLLGSVYATCGNAEGLNCILGTGSNICYFDGKKIHDGHHGLGYVLGDEGSGTFFGKKILLSFLYKKMPADLSAEFKKAFPLEKEQIITNVYQKPFPNIYLASFSRFMASHKDHPFILEILRSGFQEFVNTNIKDYPKYTQVPCHFVGSIAYYYQDVLKSVLVKNGIEPGKILQKPIQELFNFIIQKEGIAPQLGGVN
ncbi:N-acetylglucosamine kinase [Pedobacter sandarakinus]|uniref:N-acetylglucosamine kinase n=1 Tax=Pedobacter sandarakinus TaxID=353156 RepID=UPI0022457EFB|nr:N-acetylglucosamine kinase [Pedobacter sandarakinus]MCX2573262.1 N-acetylglucosamine kinase [Pedobacter sandarakinus]